MYGVVVCIRARRKINAPRNHNKRLGASKPELISSTVLRQNMPVEFIIKQTFAARSGSRKQKHTSHPAKGKFTLKMIFELALLCAPSCDIQSS